MMNQRERYNALKLLRSSCKVGLLPLQVDLTSWQLKARLTEKKWICFASYYSFLLYAMYKSGSLIYASGMWPVSSRAARPARSKFFKNMPARARPVIFFRRNGRPWAPVIIFSPPVAARGQTVGSPLFRVQINDSFMTVYFARFKCTLPTY
jgi:hypothetical protein